MRFNDAGELQSEADTTRENRCELCAFFKTEMEICGIHLGFSGSCACARSKHPRFTEADDTCSCFVCAEWVKYNEYKPYVPPIIPEDERI